MSPKHTPKDPEAVKAGRRIQLAREALAATRGIGYTAFLNTMKISDSRLSNWENGTNYPRTEMLKKMNALLGISTDWVLCGQTNNLPREVRVKLLTMIAGTPDEHLIAS